MPDVNKLKQMDNSPETHSPAPQAAPAASTPTPTSGPASHVFPDVLSPESRRIAELSARVDELENRIAALESRLKKDS